LGGLFTNGKEAAAKWSEYFTDDDGYVAFSGWRSFCCPCCTSVASRFSKYKVKCLGQPGKQAIPCTFDYHTFLVVVMDIVATIIFMRLLV